MCGKFRIAPVLIVLAVLLVGLVSCEGGNSLPLAQTQNEGVIGEAYSFVLPDAENRDASWLESHQEMQSGNNLLEPQKYIQSSFDVTVTDFLGTDVLEFPTTGEDCSYVMYGLSGINQYQEIHGLGMNTLTLDEGRVFHVAVSDYESGRFEWFGPYTDDEEIVLDLKHRRNVNQDGRAYVVIALSGSEDQAIVGSISVEVDYLPGSPVDPKA